MDCFYCSQKKELFSLRAKVNNFETGNTFLKLQNEVEHYKSLYEKEKERSAKYRDNANQLEREKNQLIKEFREKLNSANEKIEQLNGRIQKLNAQVHMNYETSSIPSSQCKNRKKITNNRPHTDRKPGGQPGHKGNIRKQLEPTEPAIKMMAPLSVIKNPDNYVKTGEKSRKVVDIHVVTTVKEYVSDVYKDLTTGKTIYRAFPEDMSNEINFGPGIKAFCALMNNYANVPLRKTSQFLKELTDGKASISIATINSLSEVFGNRTKENRDQLFKTLSASPYLHNDGTNIMVNGKQCYVYVSSNGKDVLYQLREHKGKEGIKGTPVEAYLGVLVHDHDKTYFNYGIDHQKCLAHELRYLKGSMENEPTLSWNKTMYEFIQHMIHSFKNGELQEENKKEEIRRRYREILETAEKEYTGKEEQLKYYNAGYNTYRRLRDYEESVLYFLDHPDVPYTNSEAERRARRIKSKTNVTGGFRSTESAEHYLEFMDYIESSRDENNNLYQRLKAIFSSEE